MKAVILVGGEGTRLRPLTYITPKAMMPVLNMPFIHHIINHLERHGIKEVILSMGYKPDPIKNYLKNVNLNSLQLEYNIEKEPLGTAGAVKFAQRFLQRDDLFFVLNGDVFTIINLDEMLKFHRHHKAEVTIALTKVDDPSHFGVVEMDTQQKILRFVEKPKKEEAPSNLINAGIYLVNRDVLNKIPDNEYYMFEYNLFPGLLSAGLPVFGFIFEDYWIDMGTPQKYLQLNTDLLTGICKQDICIADAVNIGKQCNIHLEAKLHGPILIGNFSKISRDVNVCGPTIIGANCKIKSNSYINNSLLWDNVLIGKNARIKNSIITSNCIIQDNAIIEDEIMCYGH